MSFKRLLLLSLLCLPAFAEAQSNYEIQIYGSDLVPQNCTMVELHSNYTINGFKDTLDGVYPTDHAIHETVEITHGFTKWFELGFYQFTAINKGQGLAYVGNHLRPRFAAPQEWKWPVGASISFEAGYQDPHYSSDTWTLEIRPILDKEIGNLYVSINPVLDYSFKGYSHNQGLIFSPAGKISYKVVHFMRAGFEYYNSIGPFSGFLPANQQEPQLAFALDFDFSPVWELNIGYVKGLTSYIESDIFKVILGRRLGKEKPKSQTADN